MTLLIAEHLAVAIDGRAILEDIDFAIAQGELVGLIGPNGAGKTTLLRALANLQPCRAGSVLFDGAPVARIPARWLAQRLAYLEQGAPAHWPLRVDKVVALGRLPHLAWWQQPGGADAAVVEQAMTMAEVETLRERIVTTLSGGERTRVLLARIFASQPELILADEPVAALDPYHQLHVMELLREHARRGGAVVAVLHDLNLAARFCDRLVLLDRGRLVQAGAPAEVLSEANLRDVYGVAARVFDHEEGSTAIPWRRLR